MRQVHLLVFGLGLFVDCAWATVPAGNRLKLHNSQFVSHTTPFYREGAKTENSGIAIEIKNEWSFRKSFSASAHVESDYSASENWNYIKPFEGFLHQKVADNTDLFIGRKLETWSDWEGEWRQGVFQPRYLQSKLAPEEAGLTGIFLGVGGAPGRMTLGVLPVHVPDINARSWIQDDKFVSYNPWFTPPASRFKLQDEMGEIHYSLDEPEVGDVLAHPGFIGKWESALARSSSRVTVAYKPMAQFVLGFPSRGLVIASAGDYMKIDIKPRILYHRVASFDQAFQWNSWRMGGSVTYDQPDDDPGPENQTRQQVTTAWIWSGFLSRPLEAEGPTAARIKIGFLKVDGGVENDLGDFAGTQTKFEPRFQYNEAYSLGISKPWRGLFKFPLDSEARFTFDRLQNGAAFTFSAGLNLARDWRATFEMDWLGLVREEAPVENGFFSRYRSNDRLGVEMSYVF